MSFIDFPIARCELAHAIVLTDETQGECAREHDCPPGTACPLCGYFTETTGVSEEAVREEVARHHAPG